MLLHVEKLHVALPGGAPVLEDTDLDLAEGEIVAILGPSGAGKTTVLRALFAPEELRRKGYGVRYAARTLEAEPAFVPQRGALFDHLDVRGNIELAQAGGRLARDVAPWLTAVELDQALAGRHVAALAGGQAQRVAVARTLAAGRRLLVLDEPSVGLDPAGVRSLARLLLKQAEEQRCGMLVITHDVALAAGACHKLLFLDPVTRKLAPLLPGWKGPAERASPEARQAALALVEHELERRLVAARRAGPTGRHAREPGQLFAALRTAGAAVLDAFRPHLFRESLTVLRLALWQGLLKPLAFYCTVALLLGITVPYVVVHLSAGLKPAMLLRLTGGSYILSLAPPISAIVFAATSGSAINAWIGGQVLRGQVVALEGIGVSPARYLLSPSWLGLVMAYLVSAAAFVASMTIGGFVLFRRYGVPDPLTTLTSDFLDPAPERWPYLVRALWLFGCYALAIASIVVSRGSSHKDRAEHVTNAMTSSVMRATLFIVAMELASIAVLFALTEQAAP
ncbi:MAG: ATP-binding cassette domain-containing protein [Myxococcales bacterium]|nr:ATP-binding cassette domain-containing protein [Myxococcales bacterium]